MSEIDIVFAEADASLSLPDGGQVRVRKGEHWLASDPVVAQYPDLFGRDPRHGLRFTRAPEEPSERPVEQATAAPGEKRATRRDRG